jgi:GT2 family glycosyltransferase
MTSVSGPVAEFADHDAALSVIIVTYNSADVLGPTLSAVSKHLPLADIIVVDNGSLDDTTAIAASYPRVRLIKGHGNIGFGAAVNSGVRSAKTRLVLVHNPDAMPTSVNLKALARLTLAKPLGLVACELSERGRRQRALHAAWGWRKELCWSLIEWYLLPREITSFRPPPRQRANAWVSGAAFIVARDEFLTLGGFDERLFLYYEDFDLSRSYSAEGLPLGSTNAVRVEHIGRASSPRNEDQTAAWALLSLIELTAKWHGAEESNVSAKWTWQLLGLIEVLGRVTRRLPIIGRRGGRKEESVSRVRGYLRAAATDTASSPHYPAARAALSNAADTGTRRQSG